MNTGDRDIEVGPRLRAQRQRLGIVFRADELTEIAGGAVSYRQVGANLKGRALQMIHERYEPGAQSGAKMLSHQGEEAGLGDQGPPVAGSRRPALRARRRATPIASTAASRTPSATPATANWWSSPPARRRRSDPTSRARARDPLRDAAARCRGNRPATLSPL